MKPSCVVTKGDRAKKSGRLYDYGELPKNYWGLPGNYWGVDDSKSWQEIIFDTKHTIT